MTHIRRGLQPVREAWWVQWCYEEKFDLLGQFVLIEYFAALILGRPPWTRGYLVYKNRLIRESLGDTALLARFKDQTALPERYRWGMDERCVEYPWLMSHLPVHAATLFDGGSALNHDYIIQHPRLRSLRTTIMTLGPEDLCFWRDGVSYLYGDLRDIPLQGERFDVVASISTLEHIGFDKRNFTEAGVVEFDQTAFLEVVKEFYRLLKPGGTFLLTVPYGTSAPSSTFRIFDAARLAMLKAAWPGMIEAENYFRYDEKGWQHASAELCVDREYVDWFMKPEQERPRLFPLQPDGAAAARAVACLALKK